MLVNIDLYVRKKLFTKKYSDLLNSNEIVMRTIYDFIHDNKITSKGILETMSLGEVRMKKQIGGSIEEIKLKDGKKYYYKVERITSQKNKKHNICFVNIRENSNDCLCFTYHTKETGNTTLILKDFNAEEDCIACEDKTYKFKIGDILMQIFLEFVRTNKELSHIKRIELMDNSTKKCYGLGLRLKYLKTIIDGIPFYAKYGFRPIEEEAQKIFRYNRLKFKENILLDNVEVDKIFEDTIKMNNKKPHEIYVKLYKKYIIKNNPIDVKQLIRKMIDLGNNQNVLMEKRLNTCELLTYVIRQFYIKLGYSDYIHINGSSLGELWFLDV